jgi:MFS family permease
MCFVIINKAAFWPGIFALYGRWVPSLERGRLLSFSGSGSQVGIITGFSLGGYLCVHGFAGGWPSIFYIFGLLNQCNCFKIKDFLLKRVTWLILVYCVVFYLK